MADTQGSRRDQGHPDDHDSDRDSDREEAPRFTTRSKGKQTMEQREENKSKGRRYTIDLGDQENEVFLVEEDGNVDSTSEVYAAVQNSEQFVQSTTENPDEWREGLKRIVENCRTARLDYNQLVSQHIELTKELSETQANVAALTQRLEEEDVKEGRLRRLRDKYREAMEALAEENDNLKAALSKQQAAPVPVEDIDSDDDIRPRRRHVSIPASLPA